MTLLRSLIPNLGQATRIARGQPSPSTDARIKPAFNVREDEHGYDLTVQLPGVAKDGLEITAQADQLTIVGRRAWTPPAEWTVLYRETPRADFELTLTHEGDIDVDKSSAELKDGVLHLMLPKAEAAKPRKIAIT
ncbi:MAG TPA: Hsp20/alpha crystallin family protein [Lacunisphaera sp.]|jgi:HSP20 family molecular chaperone IbpA|nr:Hsp20/alpha crystallin family protein [Lacunisphaera sp.]